MSSLDFGPDLYDAPGPPHPGQENPAVRLQRTSELRFGVEQHRFLAPCGCVFEWDTAYDDPHWHLCVKHRERKS